ncbi:MAG: nitroreductase family protein [Actinomycetota bacterium]
MEFRDVVRRRRMVRNYTDEPVDPDALHRILDAARRAPSAGHTQGQSFVVVTDAETRRRVAEAAGESEYVAAGFDPWLSRAPVHVVVCTCIADYEERYREPDKANAPAASDWEVPYWHVDAGAALMLLLLAAVDEGLAAGLSGVHAFEGLRDILGIPEDVTPVGVVTIGHGAPDRPSGSLKRGRKTRDEVIHYNAWSE